MYCAQEAREIVLPALPIRFLDYVGAPIARLVVVHVRVPALDAAAQVVDYLLRHPPAHHIIVAADAFVHFKHVHVLLNNKIEGYVHGGHAVEEAVRVLGPARPRAPWPRTGDRPARHALWLSELNLCGDAGNARASPAGGEDRSACGHLSPACVQGAPSEPLA